MKKEVIHIGKPKGLKGKKSNLTKKEFLENIKYFGYNIATFSSFIGVGESTIKAWNDKNIPLYVEKILSLMGTINNAKTALDK